MNIDKNTILEMLHGSGQHEQADQAAQELPDKVDTEQHSGLLARFGVNPADLIAKFTNGGTGESGGVGGLLGKL